MPSLQVPMYAQGSCGITHVDAGLLRYFFEKEGCGSFLDVGCGPGGQVQTAGMLGYRAIGIDVDPAFYRTPGVALIDLCVAPVVLPQQADLVWSVEVAEHIPAECISNYLVTLTCNAKRAIVMTASQMERPLHVSVHPPDWWRDAMERHGWRLDENSSTIIARESTMQREFLRETGMIFRKGPTNA